MAAEITVFSGILRNTQAAYAPFQSATATFTANHEGVMRVYANGGPVVLTISGISWTLPLGTVEYFCVADGQTVTVA